MTETGTAYCAQCKRDDLPDHHVTVQRDGTPLCYRCVNDINERHREEARQARAQAPRCECPGCNRRGTWKLATAGTNHLLVCGNCKNRIQAARNRQTAGWSALALLGASVLTRDQLLELAATGRRRTNA